MTTTGRSSRHVVHSFMVMGFNTVPAPFYVCGAGSGATYRCGPRGADKMSPPTAPDTRREKINTNVKLNRSTQSLVNARMSRFNRHMRIYFDPPSPDGFHSGSGDLGQAPAVWLTKGVEPFGYPVPFQRKINSL